MFQLRSIIIAFVAVIFGLSATLVAAEKPLVTKVAKGKKALKKGAEPEARDGEPCVPFKDATKPNPKRGSVQGRLARGYEPWREIPLKEQKKTLTFTDPVDPNKKVELPVTSTQFCDPQTRVYKTVQGFPGFFTRASEFGYCSCSNPANVRLVPDLKYDRKSHIICNGELRCPPRPKAKK